MAANNEIYTHKRQGGVFKLVNQSVEVEGLDQTLVQYSQDSDPTPKLMLQAKWQSEYRQLLPLECHYCGGTGKDPAKTNMPCGYCYGSSLLNFTGDPLTKCDKTSDLVRQLISTLKKTIDQQAATITTLRSLPGVTQLERQASFPTSQQVHPDNNRGPGGAKFCGD